jgi:PEP-CTERM motif
MMIPSRRLPISAVASIAALACLSAVAQTAPVGPSDLGFLNVPFTVSYGDSFNAPQAAVGTSLYTFTDAYTFTIGGAAAYESFTATINLGNVLNIANFQAALFNGTPLAAPVFPGTGAGSHIGFTGSTSGAVTGLAWNSGSGGFITLSAPSLAAGSYTFEVRGKVSGLAGGSYAGVMNLAPVPEASSTALLFAGLGVFGVVAVRRRGQAG